MLIVDCRFEAKNSVDLHLPRPPYTPLLTLGWSNIDDDDTEREADLEGEVNKEGIAKLPEVTKFYQHEEMSRHAKYRRVWNLLSFLI